MRKTGEEIEAEVFGKVKSSALVTLIGGNVYRKSTRPFNSQAEDIVVSFLAGQDGQKQTSVVNVNAYVSDIDNGDEVFVKDVERCTEIGVALCVFKESLITAKFDFPKAGYKYLADGNVIETFEEPDIHQHFVNLRLKIEYLDIE